MNLDITPLLQAAVMGYRSPEPNGSNGALGLSKLMGISNGILSRKVNPLDTGSHCSPEEVVKICRESGDLTPLH
ncbi:MAG: phage regulatory CII family protein, partial [Blastomonas fulva]